MNMQLSNLPGHAFLLHTERLRLLPVTRDDVPVLWPHMRDPAVSRYMSWLPHQSMEETKKFVSNAVARAHKGEVIHWCVWKQEAFCGLFSIIAIKTSHHALTYNQGELAYWCAPAAQGRGVMTEAGKAIIEFAFNTAGFHKLTVAHRPENEPSERLINRLGFRPVGIQREHYCKNGEWHDQHNYELLAAEYVHNVTTQMEQHHG